jgi:hypothetical protein
MNAPKWIRFLFLFACWCEVVVGLPLLVFPERIVQIAGFPAAGHNGYLQFPAALILIYGIMFVRIAHAPLVYRGLVIYGILFKAAFCALVFSYWASGDSAPILGLFFFVDVGLLAGFIAARRSLNKLAGH